jgi:transcriptional regulator with XRE-family HTH domain
VSRSKNQQPATLEQAFGQVLLARREEKGLSQMDLAVAAGYSLRYMGDVERGAKSATLRTMNDLATLLDLSLGMLIVEAEELLNGKPKPAKKPVNRPKGQ